VITGIKGRINLAVWGPLERITITAAEDAAIGILESEVGYLAVTFLHIVLLATTNWVVLLATANWLSSMLGIYSHD
jgi:hypothetical protein